MTRAEPSRCHKMTEQLPCMPNDHFERLIKHVRTRNYTWQLATASTGQCTCHACVSCCQRMHAVACLRKTIDNSHAIPIPDWQRKTIETYFEKPIRPDISRPLLKQTNKGAQRSLLRRSASLPTWTNTFELRSPLISFSRIILCNKQESNIEVFNRTPLISKLLTVDFGRLRHYESHKSHSVALWYLIFREYRWNSAKARTEQNNDFRLTNKQLFFD